MKIEKVKKLAANLHDKTEHVIHIRNLKQTINVLVLKKVHKVIKYNQNAWLKPYFDTDLRKEKQKMILKKTFFNLINNAVSKKL